MMNYAQLKVAELRALAEKQGIEGWEDLSKPELVSILQANSGGPVIPSEEEASDESAADDESDGEEAEEEEEEASDESAADDESSAVPRTPVRPQSEVVEPPQLMSQKARAMKAKLADEVARGKVETVFINRQDSEKIGTVKSIGLNGYHLHIRKGERVVVPRTVANFLWQMEEDANVALQHRTRFNSGEKPELE